MNNNYIKISDFILLFLYNFIYDKFYGNNNGLKFSSKIKTKFYMNMNYIPTGQIFGIINIKIETAETLKQIEAKQRAAKHREAN